MIRELYWRFRERSRRFSPRTLLRAGFRQATGLRPSFDGHRFLFIGGLHRSGTSIVHRLLAAHPDASAIEGAGVPEDEGQHLQRVFPPSHDHGGPGRFAFDPAAHLTESSPLATGDARTRLIRDWGRYYDFRKRVFLEKSPPNLLRARFFQALFPDAAFLFIVRHPAATALATEKWSRTSPEELLRHWFRAHEIMLSDLAYLSRALVVRYEDVVADPDPALARICAFADLSPIRPAEDVVDHNPRYFARWAVHMDTGDAEITTLGRDNAPLLARFGYRLEEPFVVPIRG